MPRIIDAKIAVENESIKAPLERLKAILKTKALTTKEKSPKVIIVRGRDKNLTTGFTKRFTNTSIRAVTRRAFVSVKEIPVNNISSI